MLRHTFALSSSAGLALLCAAGVAVAAGETVTLTSGLHLNNPRGLAFDQKGTLYVSDSSNGAVVAIRDGFSANPIKTTVLSGLSVGGDGGTEGLSIKGNNKYVVVGSATDKTGGPTAGYLIKFEADGEETFVADVGSYDYGFTDTYNGTPEAANIDDPAEWPDSNPYGILVDDGGIFVADAGANLVVEVKPNGTIRIVAALPKESVGPALGDAVPTSLAKGPDGLLYVGTLRGRIYRFNPNVPGSTPVQNFGTYGNIQMLQDDTNNLWHAGAGAIVGLAFGPGGLYATQIFGAGFGSPGDVIRIDVQKDGSAGAVTHYGTNLLSSPNFLTIGPDGNVYVSNTSIGPPIGEVARITVCDDTNIQNHAGYPSKDKWCKPHDNH